MNRTIRKELLRFALATLGIAFITPISPAAATTVANAPDCSAPEYRQLDFWIGDWDTCTDRGCQRFADQKRLACSRVQGRIAQAKPLLSAGAGPAQATLHNQEHA